MSDIQWWVWLIIGIVVVAIVAAVALAATRRSEAQRREEADGLRDQARAKDVEIQQEEAAAMATRAEAEKQRLDADRLERQAQERERSAEGARDEVHEHLAKADSIDPEVDDSSDADDGKSTWSAERNDTAADETDPRVTGDRRETGDTGPARNI